MESLITLLQNENLMPDFNLNDLTQDDAAGKEEVTYAYSENVIYVGYCESQYAKPHWIIRATTSKRIEVDDFNGVLKLQVQKTEFLTTCSRKTSLDKQIYKLRESLAAFLGQEMELITSQELLLFIKTMTSLDIGFKNGAWGRDNIYDFIALDRDQTVLRQALLQAVMKDKHDNLPRLVKLLARGIPYEIIDEFWDLPDSWTENFCIDIPRPEIYEFGNEIMRNLVSSRKIRAKNS